MKWLPGALVTVVLAGAGALWHLSGETADTKRRVQNVEDRVKDDRRDTRQNINEVKEHVKLIDSNTQMILQELRAMKATQEAERRRQR